MAQKQETAQIMAVVRDKVGKVLQELVDKMLMTKPEEPVPHMM